MTSAPAEPDDPAEIVRALYGALNERDVPAAVAALTADVDWPDAWRGGRLQGCEEVAAHFRRTGTGPSFLPYAVTTLPDGRIAADVSHRVRDDDGTVLLEGTVRHVHTVRGGRVARMDVEEPPPG